MAGPASTSSNSSQTLTNAPGVSIQSSFADSSSPTGAVDMLALFETIQSGNRHGFLQPTPSIVEASLQLAKSTLDSYAGQLSDEQQQRLKEANKKRKRHEDVPRTEVLKIRKLHVDGFESGQVWQQARRIISSALQDCQEALNDLEEGDEIEADGANGNAKSVRFTEVGSEDGSVDDEEDDSDDDDDEDSAEDVSDSEENLAEEELGNLSEDEDDLEVIEDDMEEGVEDSEEDEDDEDEESTEEFIQDPNGLNDGFFSIDDFNKQTQWFENQDARADPHTDAASDDEEEVNWHADPLTEKPTVKSKVKDEETEDDIPSNMDDEEEGPTFGDMDLDAPEGDSEDEEADGAMDDDMDEFNANDIFFKDFFAPPAKKGSKTGKTRKPKQPKMEQPDEKDMEIAMADVRRDLFDDESDREESEDALSEASAGDPKSRKSAHERRQAKLAEEIRKLEAENVAAKKWTLSGEAKATERAQDSLLQEDLDFETIGKPVTVITPEVSESIEDMIKRRILAQEFNEVIRRRPDSLDQSSGTRRGLIELDDAKAKQSLAELYEEDHVKNSNPDAYVSKADEKLRKEEREIEQMWKEVSSKLDALSSWHYKPKPAAPSLTIVSDVATISMEDAQPTTAQGVSGGDNTLAPQEIYRAGKDTAEKGEVVAKSGLPVAKQELSREDKTRRRRREKERIRKAGGFGDNKLTGKARAQNNTLGDLKKGGVKVINKKGEVLDMEGNKAKAAKTASSGNFKL